MAFGLLIQGFHIKNMAGSYDETCKKNWDNLFPSSRLPVDIAMTLQSEEIREKGLRKDPKEALQYYPALDTISEIINAVPPQIPIRLDRVDISGHISVISGQARSHGEVEKIANQLAQIKDIKVLPPATEHTADGTVRFNLRIERKENVNGSGADALLSNKVSENNLQSHSSTSGLDHTYRRLAMAEKSDQVNGIIEKSGTKMCHTGPVADKAKRTAETDRGSSHGFTHSGRLSRRCGKKGIDDTEPDKLHSSAIPKTSWRQSLCSNRNTYQIFGYKNRGYGEAYLVSATAVTRAYSDRPEILGRLAGQFDMAGGDNCCGIGIQSLVV
jgi:hypothetical protein